MSKLILTVGLNNCGKSTWAENYVKDNPNTVILSRDHIRYEVLKLPSNYRPEISTELLVTDILKKEYDNAMYDNVNIILADCNLTEITRRKWVSTARYYKQDIEFIIFHSTYVKRKEVALHLNKDLKYYEIFDKFLDSPPTPGVKYVFI